MPDESAASICDSIIQGTYPQSEDLLTSELSTQLIPSLLTHISETRREISDEIRATSKGEAGDVDQWILQAKKVQEDIARCKLDSQKIVQEHTQLRALRDQATDYQHKVDLLEAEIDFTERLKREFHSIALVTQSLKGIEDHILQDDLFGAAQKLLQLDGEVSTLSRSRTSILIRDLKDELRLKTRVKLEAKLNSQIQVRRDSQKVSLEIQASEIGDSSINSDSILSALGQVGEPQDVVEALVEKLKAFILHPLRPSSRLKLATYEVGSHSITLQLGKDSPPFDLVFNFVSDLIRFLQSSISKTIREAAVSAIFPDLMALLVTDWLTPNLPTELNMLDKLDDIRRQMHRILEQLRSLGWQGQTELQNWEDSLNRVWLNKRKATILDAVRKGLAASKGVLRKVERVERQVIPTETRDAEDSTDNWDASWDDERNEQSTSTDASKPTDDDDASGWGFDDEEDAEEKPAEEKNISGQNDADEEDAEDAWGWDDENPVQNKSEPDSQTPEARPNGTQKIKVVDKEHTLSEWYSISEVPDHMIDIISRELSDAQTLQETQHTSLNTSLLSRGLLALPTLALAMFRATAPSYYGASPSLTDIHRYNDSLYIAEQLRHMNSSGATNTNGGSAPPNLDTDIQAMEKFARLAYSKEMETQRLIVWDLLEGAQGFTSCTQFPYSHEIENAVLSVVDRVRTLHGEWQPILGTSHLMQSTGAILAMVVGKVIYAIEDMDDISEPESQRLTAFCQQIAALDDLFPHDDSLTGTPVSTTPVYVPSWFRFQYLIQILESSLVDIRYLWTEGELSLEFSQREVVSLIQALFAESRHRRDAINAILAKKGPWDQ
jgi:centromere/kinetochore protein ZW10